MRAQLLTGSISIDKGDYRGVAKYCEGHGFDIDVFCDGKRIAMRNAAWPTPGDGDRDTALVSDTIDAVADGRPLGNTIFL